MGDGQRLRARFGSLEGIDGAVWGRETGIWGVGGDQGFDIVGSGGGWVLAVGVRTLWDE